MANAVVSTVQEWFRGPKDEEVALPQFFSVPAGGVVFNVERMVLLLLTFITMNVCFGDGHAFLGFVAFLAWIGLAVLTVVDFIRVFSQQPSIAGTRADGSITYVYKWYARLITIIAGGCLFFLLVTLIS